MESKSWGDLHFLVHIKADVKHQNKTSIYKKKTVLHFSEIGLYVFRNIKSARNIGLSLKTFGTDVGYVLFYSASLVQSRADSISVRTGNISKTDLMKNA